MTKDTETNLTDYALHRLLDSAKLLAEYRAGESHGFWLHIDRTVVEKATAMLDEMLVAMEDEGV